MRELENSLVRAAVLAPGPTLMPRDLALARRGAAAAARRLARRHVRSAVAALVNDPDRPATELHALVIARVERPLIELTLERTGGNQLQAADILGINRNTLRKKITALDHPRCPRGSGRVSGPMARCAPDPALYPIVDPLDTGPRPRRRSRAPSSPAARRLLQLRAQARRDRRARRHGARACAS